MTFVQWRIAPKVLGRVHLVQNRGITLCGRAIRGAAIEVEKPPRDKATICQKCREIDAEQQRYRNVFK